MTQVAASGIVDREVAGAGHLVVHRSTVLGLEAEGRLERHSRLEERHSRSDTAVAWLDVLTISMTSSPLKEILCRGVPTVVHQQALQNRGGRVVAIGGQSRHTTNFD